MNVHGTCGATWTGARACHCSGCCRTFSGLHLFDAHRRGYGERGSCLEPEEMPGVELRDGIWRHPQMTEDEKRTVFAGR